MQRLRKKLTSLTNKAQISEKEYNFLLGRMYFAGDNGYQNFLVFALMLNSLILDNSKIVTNWILTIISSEKIKPFNV